MNHSPPDRPGLSSSLANFLKSKQGEALSVIVFVAIELSKSSWLLAARLARKLDELGFDVTLTRREAA
jgi:hypothetical protein